MSDETTEREATQAAGHAGAVTASPRSAGELMQQLQMRQIELEIENDALSESVAAIRHSDGWTELIIDSVAEAMVVVDSQGRVVRANRGAHETFGYPAGSMPGLGVEALVPERFRTGH
ncbi:MAG: PAS domain-containing protein, partial [Rhodocyclales bacterium]|nr:PAS domain-containing protein [Rhodocyclales bacterium]